VKGGNRLEGIVELPVKAEATGQQAVLEQRSSRRKTLSSLAVVLALGAILALGAYFRFVGLNWDENQHLHPDERFLTMVETAIQLPSSLSQYFDSATSPLNPVNRGHTFFVYGDLPITLVRVVAEWVKRTGYDQVTLLGRAMSALFDLAAVFFLFLIGRRLYDTRVGLLAAALSAMAVLNIQQSHFFTADTFTNFFVVLTMFGAVLVVDKGRWIDFLLMAVALGAAVASRINVITLAGIAVLAVGLRLYKVRKQDRVAGRRSGHLEMTLLQAVVAAVLSVVAFRVFQPYAFEGPGFLNFGLDKRWLDNMNAIRAQASGDQDLPFAHQWTDRWPIVFPWVNMVVWGMGLPLGLAGWSGWLLGFIEMIRRSNWERHCLPMAWITGVFLYHGIQFSPSMRYFLQIYPFLALMAAYLLVKVWDAASETRRQGDRETRGLEDVQIISSDTLSLRPRVPASPRLRVLAQLGAALLVLVVVVGTGLWAYAFTRIYTRPVSRVEASRWIYDYIPSAATVQLETDDNPTAQTQVILPTTIQYRTDGPPIVGTFSLRAPAKLTGISLNYVSDPARAALPRTFEVVVSQDPAGQIVSGKGQATVMLASAGNGHESRVEIPIAGQALSAKTTYYVTIRLSSGPPAQGRSSRLGNEHWDDGLPLRLDGRDGGSMYAGVTFENYAEDEPRKLDLMLGWLDQADYIFLTSNRLYDSIPRLPMRYPMTTRYYQALFDGRLGFEKIKEFTSYPNLGSIQFPDQGAEEAFSVYDHPKVTLFQKTPAYSREQARVLLAEGIEWDQIRRLWPKMVNEERWRARLQRIPVVGGVLAQVLVRPKTGPGAPPRPPAKPDSTHSLMLSSADWQAQRQGGTWSSLFDRASAINQSPVLGLLVWLLVIEGLGWLAFPIAFVVFRNLAERGAFVAKGLGLLLIAYAAWLAGSLRVLPFGRGTLIIMVGLMGLVSGVIVYRQWSQLVTFIRRQRRLLLIGEGLFLAFFLAFTLVRMGNPDLWHPAMGGEKPMDFAYLNAVIKSTSFPPYDPWFAGGYINYYYFGFVIVASQIILTGVVPYIAYNFTVPLLFALTAMGGFTVAYNLAHREAGEQSSRGAGGIVSSLPLHTPATLPRRSLAAGILGALFVAVIGNLGEINLILHGLWDLSQVQFQSTIPGLAGLVSAGAGLVRVAQGKPLPFRPEWWYWNPTRVIPETINEFPFFTFLYADLHAHMIALPLTLMALALAVNIIRGRSNRPANRFDYGLSLAISWFVHALIVGVLWPTNTWDYPTYLLIILGAWLLYEYQHQGLTWRGLWAAGWRFVLLAVVSRVLFQPYFANYATAYTSMEIWQGGHSSINDYLTIHGFFLFVAVSFMLIEAGRWIAVYLFGGPITRSSWASSPALGVVNRSAEIDTWQSETGEPLNVLRLGAMALLGVGAVAYLAQRMGLPVVGFAIPLIALAAVLTLRRNGDLAGSFVPFLTATALALTAVVEIVVLKGDIGRMNTVFKFYLQVWVLLGLAAAVDVVWFAKVVGPPLGSAVQEWSHGWRQVWWGIFAVLFVCVLLYPIFATRAKVNDRFSREVGPTVDGTAYMLRAAYTDGPPNGRALSMELKWDREAIFWMQDNIPGSPVILEGHAPEYRWGSRVSIYTGLPTVVGWNWHQRQQRSIYTEPLVEKRIADVATMYNTRDKSQALELLRRYQVSYIYVGQLEKAYYDPAGLAKFDQMAGSELELVYENSQVKIYRLKGA